MQPRQKMSRDEIANALSHISQEFEQHLGGRLVLAKEVYVELMNQKEIQESNKYLLYKDEIPVVVTDTPPASGYRFVS
ncbi:MAG: hypothetical protein IKQ15_00675 [Kiritimatiellae bacterium]|nr:hypothetical protein [Kiritimatiellia bacterium]